LRLILQQPSCSPAAAAGQVHERGERLPPPNPNQTHDMKRTSTRSWASKLVESFQNDGCKSDGDGVSLTAYEADLLEPPPGDAYKPWVVPLTFRPNCAAEETAED